MACINKWCSCHIDTSLKHYELEQIDNEKEAEEHQKRVDHTYQELCASSSDFVEALREATHGNELIMTKLHIAFVNGDIEKIGKLILEVTKKELRECASRITD